MKLGAQDIEKILDIYAPYRVKSITIDEDKTQLIVRVEDTDVSLLKKLSLNQLTKPLKRWTHIQVGHYSSVIEFQSEPGTFSTNNKLNPPPFIGHESNSYTHELKRNVLFAKSQGLPNDLISSLLHVDEGILEEISSNDISAEPQPASTEKCRINVNKLPESKSQIWRQLITSEFEISTENMGFRFLLSRAQLDHTNDPSNAANISRNASEIYGFFTKNTKSLSSEIQQIIERHVSNNQLNKSEKLTLTPDHPIMEHILSSKVSLVDAGVALSLKLTNLRSQFKFADDDLKIELQKSLFDFIKKQAPSLKKELDIIRSTMMEMRAPKPPLNLPHENNNIWMLLLTCDQAIESKNITYLKTLSTLQSWEDINAASYQLYKFVLENKDNMNQEISEINKLVRQIGNGASLNAK